MLKNSQWVWLRVVVAFLLNPLVPVHLPRAYWQAREVLVAVILAASMLTTRKQ
jgi:hypothetical protein